MWDGITRVRKCGNCGTDIGDGFHHCIVTKPDTDYRDRLDRMVAACAAGDCANPNAGNWKPRDMVAYAQVLLAAIDDAVREKQDDEQG